MISRKNSSNQAESCSFLRQNNSISRKKWEIKQARLILQSKVNLLLISRKRYPQIKAVEDAPKYFQHNQFD